MKAIPTHDSIIPCGTSWADSLPNNHQELFTGQIIDLLTSTGIALTKWLVGHDLLDQFPDGQLRILTNLPTALGHASLFRETRRHWLVDEISDHLPLVFDLNPEEAIR